MNKFKRLAIYFFYDKDGIVDRYIQYFLKDLRDNLDYLLIVSNGKLNSEGKIILEKYGEVLERENKGFDVWAYKSGIEHIGWDNLSNYDELIMLNSTIMGPVFPFCETFKKMDQRSDIDFWGITKFFKYKPDPLYNISYGYIPDHIQSHFIAVRKSMFESVHFKSYWENMPMINSYIDAVGKHEAIFTKKFSDLGYKWDLSIDMEHLRKYSGYPLMHCPKFLIEKYRCPIFKRRSFFVEVDDVLSQTTGEAATELYDYLNNQTHYDTDMIWENILRNYNQYNIVKNLNLIYILPSNMSCEVQSKNKCAIIYHVYFTDILEQTLHYLKSIPDFFHVYITTNTEEKKDIIEKEFADNRFSKFQVRLVKNRGRDVSSLLVAVKDIIMDYDIACFAHDKKTTQVNPESAGASFAYKCLENTLSNNHYVNNILNTFANNPRLGLICPPEPNHSVFYPTIGKEWRSNFNNVVKLAKKLGLNVPMDESKPPIAPYGSVFWFRPKALKPLYEKNWKYEDFPVEPLDVDGTISHVIERIHPFVVQDSGYYPAICMTDKFAAIEYNNLRYYLRGFNDVAFDVFQPDMYPVTIELTRKALKKIKYIIKIKRNLKSIVKRILIFSRRVFKKMRKVLTAKK